MKKQRNWELFGKVLAVIGVLVLIIVVCFGEREQKETFVEPPQPTKIEENVDTQAKPTESIEQKEESDIQEVQEIEEKEEEEQQENTVVVLPFVPAN